jgi:hypothetical protein
MRIAKIIFPALRGRRFDRAERRVRRLAAIKFFTRVVLSEEVGEEMSIDPDKVQTQEETGEPAAIDEVEGRVQAEMKIAEGRAKESVAQGLQDKELEREGRKLQQEGERELEQERQSGSEAESGGGGGDR